MLHPYTTEELVAQRRATAGEAADNHGQKRAPRDGRNRSSTFL
jgi:hypothetical protein